MENERGLSQGAGLRISTQLVEREEVRTRFGWVDVTWTKRCSVCGEWSRNERNLALLTLNRARVRPGLVFPG